MQYESIFEYLGLSVVLALMGATIYGLQQLFGDAAGLQAIRGISPWLANHAKPVMWVAIVACLIVGIGLPPILITRGKNEGASQLAMIGMGVFFVSVVIVAGFLLFH